MRTIRSFERALGRTVLWAGDKEIPAADDLLLSNFTPRLRVYPHALREANAYYSPQKRALLFGYFRPARAGADDIDSNWVFTCLSQDIVAHETHPLPSHISSRPSNGRQRAQAVAVSAWGWQ